MIDDNWLRRWTEFLKDQNERTKITKEDIQSIIKNGPYNNTMKRFLTSKKKRRNKRLKLRSKKND